MECPFPVCHPSQTYKHPGVPTAFQVKSASLPNGSVYDTANWFTYDSYYYYSQHEISPKASPNTSFHPWMDSSWLRRDRISRALTSAYQAQSFRKGTGVEELKISWTSSEIPQNSNIKLFFTDTWEEIRYINNSYTSLEISSHPVWGLKIFFVTGTSNQTVQ